MGASRFTAAEPRRRPAVSTPEELEAARASAFLELARGLDPSRASRAEEELRGALEGVALGLGVALAAAYPAVGRELSSEPSLARTLCATGLSGAREREPLLATMKARLGSPLEEGYRRELRLAAREERLRIAARELLPVDLCWEDV